MLFKINIRIPVVKLSISYRGFARSFNQPTMNRMRAVPRTQHIPLPIPYRALDKVQTPTPSTFWSRFHWLSARYRWKSTCSCQSGTHTRYNIYPLRLAQWVCIVYFFQLKTWTCILVTVKDNGYLALFLHVSIWHIKHRRNYL